MGRGDISEGGDANELESGYYINGNFRKLTNSPFSSGWGGRSEERRVGKEC